MVRTRKERLTGKVGVVVKMVVVTCLVMRTREEQVSSKVRLVVIMMVIRMVVKMVVTFGWVVEAGGGGYVR